VSPWIPNGRRKSLLDNSGLSELVNKLAIDAGSTYAWTTVPISDALVEVLVNVIG
jgi:hypothetical protein